MLRNGRAPFVRLAQIRHQLPGHYSEISTPDRATVNRTNRKELKSDFAVVLEQRIHLSGYLPFAQFMREALQHPDYGYYSTKKNVIGGEKADFITAAEIPFFGDVLAAWVMDVWQKMGTPRNFQLVEMGPGKGTLMLNMLRQIRAVLPNLLNFMTIHMVEMGAARQEEQRKALAEFQTASGRIKWHNSIEALPFLSQPTCFIANEYFDALPISLFRYTERGWMETLVDVDEDPATEAHFRLVNAPGVSFANFLMPDDLRHKKDVQQGDTVEVCTHGMSAMETLMKRMVDSGKAAALIIDYGKDEHMTDTLRGIRGHKFVNPLLAPGDIDLSAWVSFKQLRWALERLPLAKERLRWFGPMQQNEFLEWNGIDARLASVLREQETKLALRVLQNFRKLTDDEEMGKNYKVFAVQTNNFPPVSPWM
jgi:NADH dehydrogenase [ubiquinone] 1 alpha subcomplex assembly factor 7